MFTITVATEPVILRLQERGAVISAALRNEIYRQTLALATYIKGSKLSGQVLQVRTGNLRRSVQAYPPELGEGFVRGVVAVDNPASVYGRVHEYGGLIPIGAHSRRTKTGKTAGVRAHTARYRERSFMRSGLADRRDAILVALRAAVALGVRGAQ